MLEDLWFDNWINLFRTFLIGTLSYVALVFFLRVSGKRTLSKLNIFDFIVTVAFGSTLATVILSKDVSLVQGLCGLGLLVLLQFVITSIEVRSPKFKKFIKSSPSLLFYDQNYRDKIMKRERITVGEVQAVLRREGYINTQEVKAVILESDGSFSVIYNGDVDLQSLREQGVVVE